jgi:hypothetical protein
MNSQEIKFPCEESFGVAAKYGIEQFWAGMGLHRDVPDNIRVDCVVNKPEPYHRLKARAATMMLGHAWRGFHPSLLLTVLDNFLHNGHHACNSSLYELQVYTNRFVTRNWPNGELVTKDIPYGTPNTFGIWQSWGATRLAHEMVSQSLFEHGNAQRAVRAAAHAFSEILFLHPNRRTDFQGILEKINANLAYSNKSGIQIPVKDVLAQIKTLRSVSPLSRNLALSLLLPPRFKRELLKVTREIKGLEAGNRRGHRDRESLATS